MPLPVRTCVKCGEEYVLTPKKPGLITHCPECSVETEKPLVAKVAYPHKNSCFMEIEITSDVRAAAAFNGAQRRRNGTSTLGSIVETKAKYDAGGR